MGSFEGNQYKCKFCFKLFTDKESCHLHTKLHSIPGNRKCLECDARFVTDKELRDHVFTHKDESDPSPTTIYCTLCDYATASLSHFEFHKLKHSFSRPYKCDLCPRDFRDQRQLVQHRVTHKREKNYHCVLCDYESHREGDLLRHTRLHANVRPYKCHIENCTRAFVEQCKLTQHIETHGKPFECNICGSNFKHLSLLRTHRRRYHLDEIKKQEIGNDPLLLPTIVNPVQTQLIQIFQISLIQNQPSS